MTKRLFERRIRDREELLLSLVAALLEWVKEVNWSPFVNHEFEYFYQRRRWLLDEDSICSNRVRGLRWDGR